MSVLFDPARIKNMIIPNRFVRSATYDGCARSGHVTDKQLKLFSDLAEGGTGLVITGIAHVHDSGQISAFQNALTDDEFIPGLKKLTDAVHARGAMTAVQLFHAGREGARFLKSKGEEAICPSVIADDPHFRIHHREATEDEIENIIQAFGDAAKRARAAGFDAVQIHGAHAYLLSQFLSPYTNRRNDRWGGVLENRLRIHGEIYENIRSKAGDDYPVMIKIGVADGFAGGLEFGEGEAAARILSEWGYDALEVSSGLRGKHYEETEFRTKIVGTEKEGYFRDWGRQIAGQVDVPVMMVGGLRTFAMMEEIIREKEADFISLCRPLIREPAIVNEWKGGGRRRPTCISCNKCFEALMKGKSLKCALDENGPEITENHPSP